MFQNVNVSASPSIWLKVSDEGGLREVFALAQDSAKLMKKWYEATETARK